ncbi:MAG: type I-D CRISPR-associated helicase Cas3' [Desulfobacterales bacterium]|nr:type I-D CRISPR-associated helicase Cas3' [Desulfobacterales bacterium]
MQISKLKLQVYKVKNSPHPLYKHQKQIYDNWYKKDAFMLISGTGSGKTIAASFPVIDNNENAIFIYPTNALIQDQKRSIENILEKMNKTYFVYDEDSYKNKSFGSVDYTLIKIDGDFLKKIREHNNFKTNGDALYYLLSHNIGKTIVLTNPDTLFLILTLKYRSSADIIALFQDFHTIVFDEFHIYWGIELTNIISSLFIMSKLKIFPKKVFLTATPSENVKYIINEFFQPMIIELETNDCGRTVVYKVDLFGIRIERDSKIQRIVEELVSLKNKLTEKRKTTSKAGYIPLMVILNSVVEIIILEKELLEAGFKKNEITPIRGLMSKQERKISLKTLVVIGTSAIEIGIDFSCDYLIFEANDSASFLQRFGRIGRHNTGIAYLLGDQYETDAMNSEKKISRYELQDFINAVYETRKSFSWFITTRFGLFVTYVQFQQFINKIKKDRNLKKIEKEELVKTFEKWFCEYVSIVLEDSISDEDKRRKANDSSFLAKKDAFYKWPKIYKSYYSLRSSFDTEFVYVKSEKDLKRNPLIKADVLSILKYGKNLKWNNPKKRLEVDGFSERNKIRFSRHNISFDDYGEIQIYDATNPHKLLINDHDSPLSNIREKHIMAFFPKRILEAKNYDWRLQAIYCNDNESVVIFGKNILIILEMFKKEQLQIYKTDLNDFEDRCL